jgi:hypothetical protein
VSTEVSAGFPSDSGLNLHEQTIHKAQNETTYSRGNEDVNATSVGFYPIAYRIAVEECESVAVEQPV